MKRLELPEAHLWEIKTRLTEEQLDEGDTRFMFPCPPSIEDMIVLIQQYGALRMEQYGDIYRYWRVGIDWFTEDSYEFVCEKENLIDALWEAVKYIDDNVKAE